MTSAVPLDNRLSFMDQAGFHLLRATGRGQLLQTIWIYEHPVDFDELRRFHRDFGYGLAGRLIERSPLPFGRHRWVSSLGPPTALHVAQHPRPRTELIDWADERAAVPIDPEKGPAWHLSVLPLDDGATVISMVGSHYVVDGFAAMLTCVEGIYGSRRDLGYPLPRSRKRFRGLAQDLRGAVRDAPEVGRAIKALGRLALAQRREAQASSASRQPAVRPAGAELVSVPSSWVFIDLPQWDARAKALNGNSFSLLAGFAARLGELLGRRRDDGTLALHIALTDRTGLDDTRAQAMQFAQVSVDPVTVTTDLTDARTAIRQALKAAREVSDERFELLPLAPLLPKPALRAAQRVLVSSADYPIACSNLGEIHPPIARIDGTDAEYFAMRGIDQNVTRADIEGAGGQLVLVAGSLVGKFSIGIVAYQAGAENSNPRLRKLVEQTLAEYELSGEIY